MINELTINWRKAEGDFADFCMDYFDDRPIEVSRMGSEGESSEVLYEANFNVSVFLERILIALFRYIFVKKYVITEIIESVRLKVEEVNSHHDKFFGIVVNAYDSLIRGSDARRLVLQVGFT